MIFLNILLSHLQVLITIFVIGFYIPHDMLYNLMDFI